MNRPEHIVFWQNIVSPHQSSFIRALADSFYGQVHVIAEQELSGDRLRTGWKTPDLGIAKCVVGASTQQPDFVASLGPNVLHILSGARCNSGGRAVARYCIRAAARMAVISETADFRGWKGLFRWVKYTTERVTLGRHWDFILAIGSTGVRWFAGCGYPRKRLFPFAYFTEDPKQLQMQDAATGPFRMIYVGRLVSGKGLEDFMAALCRIPRRDWILTIVGDGELRQALERLAAISGIRDRINFAGAVDNGTATDYISTSDLLVLPSNGKEGWGAVVNEALARGVPVVCSRRCGASDLVREPSRGAVFRTGKVGDLVDALQAQMALGRPSTSRRREIQDWARSISGQSGAHYFMEVAEHVYFGGPRPVAPWLA